MQQDRLVTFTASLDGGEAPRVARFEIRRKLGSGAFGAVFEAFDKERRAPVALKALRHDDAAIIVTFKQEFRALADIVHPNLVQLYELHREAESWFFTMELVDGTDAIAFVRGGSAVDSPFAPTHAVLAVTPGPPSTLPASRLGVDGGDSVVVTSPVPTLPLPKATFDEARLRSVLSQLVDGLSGLHEAGKLHRDIKPSNVLVTREGRVVLVDFGLVMSHGDSTAVTRGAIAGTPAYMAPEQVYENDLSPAADFYAVGALLYEVMTGKAPFEGALLDVLRQKQSTDPPAPSSLVSGIPADLDRLCVELLSRSPEARPQGQALRERVGLPARSGRLRRSTSIRDTFVGRAAERSALARSFAAMLEERSAGVVLVGGPSGIGKSALCRRAGEELRQIEVNALVLSARCYEQESVPYKAIDGLVDALARHLKKLPSAEVEALLPPRIQALSRLFPALSQLDALADVQEIIPPAATREARRQAFLALRELLTRLARARPLVLFIDDLQWGDADSSAMLIEVLSPPEAPPALFVATYRNDDTARSPCLRTLLPALSKMAVSGLRVTEVTLDDLPGEEARALARQLLLESGETSSDLADAIAREAGGRPFFVQELARHWDRAPASLHSPARESSDPVVSLDAIVRARTGELPAPARRLLEVVAVAGRPVSRAAASAAAELGSEEPRAYLLLRNQRLLRMRESEGEDELETYHDRIREAVTFGLSPAARADYLGRLARALEETGQCDAETLCAYWLGAGNEERAAHHAAAAAEEAARVLAFDNAVRFYRLALDLRSAREPAFADLRQLREGLGNALVSAGRGLEAAQALLSAIEGSEPEYGLDLRRRSAEQLLMSGHVDPGLAELGVVLDKVAVPLPQTPRQTVLWLLLHSVWLVLRGLRFRRVKEADVPQFTLLRIDTCGSVSKSLSLVDTARGVYFAVRQLRLALSAGEPHRVLRSLALLVAYGSGLGGKRPLYPIRRASAAAHALAIELGDVYGSCLLRMCEGIGKVLRGLWREGRLDLEEAVTTFRERCTAVTWEIDTSHQFILIALAWEGAWKELRARLPPLLADARARGDLYGETIFALYAGHLVALMADDPVEAERGAREAISAWSQERFQVQDYYYMLACAETLLYEEEGKGRRALDHLDAAAEALSRSLLPLFELVQIETLWSRFRAASAAVMESRAKGEGTPPRLLALAARAARKLKRVNAPWARSLTALTGATLAAFRGERERALRLLTSAEEGFEASGARHYAAAARHRRGALSGGAGGKALMTASEAWMREQGAANPGRIFALLLPGPWEP